MTIWEIEDKHLFCIIIENNDASFSTCYNVLQSNNMCHLSDFTWVSEDASGFRLESVVIIQLPKAHGSESWPLAWPSALSAEDQERL